MSWSHRSITTYFQGLRETKHSVIVNECHWVHVMAAHAPLFLLKTNKHKCTIPTPNTEHLHDMQESMLNIRSWYCACVYLLYITYRPLPLNTNTKVLRFQPNNHCLNDRHPCAIVPSQHFAATKQQRGSHSHMYNVAIFLSPGGLYHWLNTFLPWKERCVLTDCKSWAPCHPLKSSCDMRKRGKRNKECFFSWLVVSNRSLQKASACDITFTNRWLWTGFSQVPCSLWSSDRGSPRSRGARNSRTVAVLRLMLSYEVSANTAAGIPRHVLFVLTDTTSNNVNTRRDTVTFCCVTYSWSLFQNKIEANVSFRQKSWLNNTKYVNSPEQLQFPFSWKKKKEKQRCESLK